MSETLDDERERIREQKLKELQTRLENGGDTPAQKDGAEAPSEPITVTGQDHFESVIGTHSVVLVDCYADWCGPCQMLEPTIDALAAETDAAVAKVDVDAHPYLAQQVGVQGVPTLVLYVDGNPVKRLVGMQDRGTLEALISQYG